MTKRREVLLEGSMRVILNIDGLSCRVDTRIVLCYSNN